MSGLDLDGRTVRKGAGSAVASWVGSGGLPPEVTATVDHIGEQGGTPLVVAEKIGGTARVLGVVQLSDVVKPGMAARFAEMRAMGIRTVMITGDNPRTAKAIAAQAGVDGISTGVSTSTNPWRSMAPRTALLMVARMPRLRCMRSRRRSR